MVKLKQKKFIIIVALIIVMLSTTIVAFSLNNENGQIAQAAVTVANSTIPSELKEVFADYTLTTVTENYDTLDKINQLKNQLNAKTDTEPYKSLLTRAEAIIRGEVRFNGMREFSTKENARNRIDQYGNLYDFEKKVLKWNFVGNVSQVTGIYGIADDTFTVYVKADDKAMIPHLIIAQSKGYVDTAWRIDVALNRGINTFTFPFADYGIGDKSGVVYIYNPYTQADQGGNVSIYIEGGGFYPVYQKGDDEDAFVEQVKEFEAQRKLNDNIPNIAELLPDYALFTINASAVYKAYVEDKSSPAKNIEFWSDYFTETFKFNGMTADPENVSEQKVKPYVRVNIRHMSRYQNAGAYTNNYHVGIFNNEDKWLADYSTSIDEYTRFATLGHEVGHVLDTGGRVYNETTNNVNAGYMYYRYLGAPASSGGWLPLTKSHSRILSDYTLNYKAYDEGRILYEEDSNYDHNYIIWYQLESVFPGYWGRLNNYYRYDTTITLNNINEKMVYYSSLATGVDLSEYFERWGLFMNGNWSEANRFRYESASQTFKNAMMKAEENGTINKVYDHYWLVDAKQFDFTLAHMYDEEEQRVYSGDAPEIVRIKVDGNSRTLEIGGTADANLLGYEIYSKIGDGEYKIAGFTYSSKFTDTYNYDGNEPTYMVKGVNRYFKTSEQSNEATGSVDDSTKPAEYVCRVDNVKYTDLKAAFDAAKNNGTVYLLADCSIASTLQASINYKVIVTVDPEVIGDITITHTSNLAFFSTIVPTATLTIKGTTNSRIILDGASDEHLFPAIYVSLGSVTVENVIVRNYTNINGSALSADDKATVNLKDCRFENCQTGGSIGAVAGGTSTTIQNCSFSDISGSKPNLYNAAIGLNTNGGSIVLDNCTFKNNGVADIYVNGDITFKTHIPQAVVAFADANNIIKLDNCSQSDKEIENIMSYDVAYKVELKNGCITFVGLNFNLTFKWDKIQTQTYTLQGTKEFVFGDEKIALDDYRYIAQYFDENNKEYHIGDTIVVEKDMTFTVEIESYLTLTLKYSSDTGLTEKTVMLKEGGKFYLPRFDDNGREIVKWVFGNTSYWAGEQYPAKDNGTLYAIYQGTFNYVIVCRDAVVEYGYVEYNGQINLSELKVDWDGLLCWRIGSQSIGPRDQYAVTSDVVLVAIYDDEGGSVYNLNESVIEFVAEGYEYDGHVKEPKVTVKVNGDAVPAECYKVTYRDNVNAGVATIIVEAQGYRAYGSKVETFNIQPVDFSADTFDLGDIYADVVYSGSQTAKTPLITWNGLTLVSDKDYTIKYTGDRVNVGTVTVTITFQGNFRGETNFSYKIVRANRDSFKVTMSGWTYGSTASSPSISGYVESGDVVYSYSMEKEGVYVKDKPQNAGNYWVKAEIAETVNYNKAVAYASFTISKATLTNVPKSFTVDSRKKTLQDVADRLPLGWSWVNATMPLELGVNTATAVYKDETNYTNSRIVVTITVTEFTVEIEKAQITIASECVYNGQAQRPTVTVKLNGDTLKENDDYTLTYRNNTNAGTATVTVTGAGIYTGEQIVSFTIAKQDISDLIEIKVADAEIVGGIYKILYDGQSHAIFATVEGMEGVIVVVDVISVTNVGEYNVKAQISADNYLGEREFTVSVYITPVEPDQPSEPDVPTDPDDPTTPDTPGDDKIPNDSTPKDDDSESINTVTVAVGVGGGVVGVGAIGGVAYLFIRRRRRR